MKINGIIEYIDLEGGFWGVRTDSGQKYIPIDIPDLLKKEGQAVILTAEKVKDAAGLHQWGTYIRILSFEVLPRSS